MYCKKCGTQNTDGVRFCKKCGADLTLTAQGAPSQQPMQPSAASQPSGSTIVRPASLQPAQSPGKPPRKRKAVLIACIVAALALVGGVVTLVLVFGRNASKRPDPSIEGLVEVDEELYFSDPQEEHVTTDEATGVIFADNELLVFGKDIDSYDEVVRIIKSQGGKLVGHGEEGCFYQVRFEDARTYEQLEELAQEFAEEDAISDACHNVGAEFSVDAVTNDQVWGEDPSNTWWLDAIDAPEAWDVVKADASVHVGVIDGQFWADHPDLPMDENSTWPKYSEGFSAWYNSVEYTSSQDYSSSNSNIRYYSCYDPKVNVANKPNGQHGTHVAGIIGAEGDNSLGIAGVAYGCSLYGYQTGVDAPYDAKGDLKKSMHRDGKDIKFSSMLVSAMENLVAEHDCKVVNMSFGFTNPATASQQDRDEINTALEGEMRKLLFNGHEFLICKSAGNYKLDASGKSYPHDWVTSQDHVSSITDPDLRSRIIVVGNVYQNDQGGYAVNPSSVDGPEVDIYAPGTDIYSTYYILDTKSKMPSQYAYTMYEKLTGTSMAAPVVAGTAALVFAACPDLSGAEVKQILCDTAGGSYCQTPGYERGMVNAEAAVRKACDRYIPKAAEFVRTWYADWWMESAADGSTLIYQFNNTADPATSYPNRVMPFIANGSAAMTDFAVVNGTSQHPKSQWTCVIGDPSVEFREVTGYGEDKAYTYKVAVSYVANENFPSSVTAQAYNEKLGAPQVDAWYVTVDMDGMVTQVQQASVTDTAQYTDDKQYLNPAIMHLQFDENLEDSAQRDSDFALLKNRIVVGIPGEGKKSELVFDKGVRNQALYFDGDGDFLDLGGGYNITGDYTFNVWLKPDESNKERNAAMLLCKELGDSGDSICYQFYLNENRPMFWMDTEQGRQIKLAYEFGIDPNKWSMVTYTYNSATKVFNIYIDGVLVVTESAEDLMQGDGKVAVGRQPSMRTGTSPYDQRMVTKKDLQYAGWMDDMMLINRTLTRSEIEALFSSYGEAANVQTVTIDAT